MKFQKISLLCVLLLCMSFIFVACGKEDRKETKAVSKKEAYPERYEELLQLIGKDQETVFDALELTEDDVELLQTVIYETPIEVKYLGYTFSVLLQFDYDTGEMFAFWYQHKCLDDVEMAEKVVDTMYEKLTGYHGKPDKEGELTEHYAKQSDIKKDFMSDEDYIAMETWNISDDMDLYLEVVSRANSNDVYIRTIYRQKAR